MRVLMLLAALTLVGCGNDAQVPDAGMPDMPDAAATAATAERGAYLVKYLLGCGDCHTTPDATGQPSMDPKLFLAGGRDFPVADPNADGGVGHVYAPNLTPDPTTGLGGWTLDEIRRAIKAGLDDQMKPLHPIMPYYMFHNLTDDDADSIALYLMSLPPAVHVVPPSTEHVPQPAPYIDDKQVVQPSLAMTDPFYASAVRGRYLVEVSCLECHTEHLMPGASSNGVPSVIDYTKQLAGGETFPLAPGFTTISANLTPASSGLRGWSVADVVNTLKTDLERGLGRPLCPPMPAGNGRLGSLQDRDLADIANYVHALPPVENGPFGCTDGGVPYGTP